MASVVEKPARFLVMMLYCACLVVTTTFLVMAGVSVQQNQPSLLYKISQHYNGMNMKNKVKPTLRGKSDIHHQHHHHHHHQLITTLCADRCESDCVVYKTPWITCYNGQILFPSDPSWSKWDILDIPLLLQLSTIMTTTTTSSTTIIIGKDDDDDTNNSSPQPALSSFRRFFFSTQNSSCANKPTDIYTLPLNACLGPFGAPRPWGNFTTATNH